MSVEFSGESVPLSCDLGDQGSKWLCEKHQLLLPLEYTWCTCAHTCSLGRGNWELRCCSKRNKLLETFGRLEGDMLSEGYVMPGFHPHSEELCVRLKQCLHLLTLPFPEKAKLQRVGSIEDHLRFG